MFSCYFSSVYSNTTCLNHCSLVWNLIISNCSLSCFGCCHLHFIRMNISDSWLNWLDLSSDHIIINFSECDFQHFTFEFFLLKIVSWGVKPTSSCPCCSFWCYFLPSVSCHRKLLFKHFQFSLLSIRRFRTVEFLHCYSVKALWLHID